MSNSILNDVYFRYCVVFFIVCRMIKVCRPNWAITFKEIFFSLLSVCGACPPTTAQTTQFPGCCLQLLCARCLRPDGQCVGVSWQVVIKTHWLLCEETFKFILKKKINQFKLRFITRISSHSKHSHSNHDSFNNTFSLVLVNYMCTHSCHGPDWRQCGC